MPNRPDGGTGVVSHTDEALRTREQLWTIHGKHYDLSTFVKRHPGGIDAIILGQGLDDCTTLFESYHPFTEKPRKMLKAYLYTSKIAPSDASHANTEHMDDIQHKAAVAHGIITTTDTSTKTRPIASHVDPFFNWTHTPLYDECKATVRAHFSPNGNETADEIHANMKATTFAICQYGVGVVVMLYAFVQFISGSAPALTYFPVIYWIVCSELMHSGSHFAISTTPMVNKLSAYMGFFHVQYHLWAVQHVIGHHVHTNIIHMDPDIHHFSQDSKEEANIPGYRTHSKQTIYPKYAWGWKLALFFQAWATTLAISFANTPKYLADRAMQVTKIRTAWLTAIRNDRLILMAGCLVFMWYHGAVYGFWSLFWSWGIHGVLFNVFSQISHTNEGSMTSTDKYKALHGIDRLEWATHQLLTSQDYSCDSWFWGLMSVNLNNQAIHHLFPSVHPCHYPTLRHKLIPVCKKYGVDYEGRSSGDFVDSVARYYGWISKLNEPNKPNVKAKVKEEKVEASIVLGDEGHVSASSRVLIVSGSLIVCMALAIPTMTWLLPKYEWAPLQALGVTLVPLILSIKSQEF